MHDKMMMARINFFVLYEFVISQVLSCETRSASASKNSAQNLSFKNSKPERFCQDLKNEILNYSFPRFIAPFVLSFYDSPFHYEKLFIS